MAHLSEADRKAILGTAYRLPEPKAPKAVEKPSWREWLIGLIRPKQR
jgi:hypothetical protein